MTIRHIVLFTLNEGVTRQDPRVAAAAELSKSHGGHITDILTWTTGFDVGRRGISADFAVSGTFADMGAVARYLDHPHHRLGVAAWSPLATWAVIDLDEGKSRERSDDVRTP
jgi:hypothetical protein